MSELQLTDDERMWLAKEHPFFKEDYLNYFATYRFEPREIQLIFRPHGFNDAQKCFGNDTEELSGESNQLGALEIEIGGLWSRTILWEVPLMSALSQSYFNTVDVDWDYSGQEGIFKITNGIRHLISYRARLPKGEATPTSWLCLFRIRHAKKTDLSCT
jgi:nicotinate phosphoribosyltransferase